MHIDVKIRDRKMDERGTSVHAHTPTRPSSSNGTPVALDKIRIRPDDIASTLWQDSHCPRGRHVLVAVRSTVVHWAGETWMSSISRPFFIGVFPVHSSDTVEFSEATVETQENVVVNSEPSVVGKAQFQPRSNLTSPRSRVGVLGDSHASS